MPGTAGARLATTPPSAALADPNLSPVERVLLLQRSAGNAAVAALLGAGPPGGADPRRPPKPTAPLAAEAKPAPATPAAAVQRLIGFELETGVPVTAKYHEKGNHSVKYWKDPGLLKYKVLGNSLLMADHLPGHTRTASERFDEMPIVEVVTEAVSETMTSANFRAKAKTWVDLAVDIRDRGKASPPAKTLRPLAATSKKYTHLGLPSVQDWEPWDRVALQSTIGLRLDQVGALLDIVKVPDQNDTFRMKGRRQAADEGSANGAALAAQVAAQFTARAPVPPTAQELADIRGFLQLTSQYLAAGPLFTTGYLKNRLPMFYKSRMSDLRNLLAQPNTFAHHLFTDNTARMWLKLKLLAQNKRDGGQKVFPGSATAPTCDAWLDAILGGTGDPLFNAAKNPWSKHLGPEAVGGQTAAVVELRNLADNMPEVGSLTLADPDGVVDFLVAVFGANQQWQGLPIT